MFPVAVVQKEILPREKCNWDDFLGNLWERKNDGFDSPHKFEKRSSCRFAAEDINKLRDSGNCKIKRHPKTERVPSPQV